MRFLAPAIFVVCFLLLLFIRAKAPGNGQPVARITGTVLRVHTNSQGARLIAVELSDRKEAVVYLDPTLKVASPRGGDTVQFTGTIENNNLLIIHDDGDVQPQMQEEGRHSFKAKIDLQNETSNGGSTATLSTQSGYMGKAILTSDALQQFQNFDPNIELDFWGYINPRGTYIIEEIAQP